MQWHLVLSGTEPTEQILSETVSKCITLLSKNTLTRAAGIDCIISTDANKETYVLVHTFPKTHSDDTVNVITFSTVIPLVCNYV